MGCLLEEIIPIIPKTDENSKDDSYLDVSEDEMHILVGKKY